MDIDRVSNDMNTMSFISLRTSVLYKATNGVPIIYSYNVPSLNMASPTQTNKQQNTDRKPKNKT